MPLNDGHEYRERLGEAASGLSLVDYLSRRYTHSSPEAWRERIASGLVLLDGAGAHSETPLRAGQSLTWRRPAWEEPEAPEGPLAILYEDEDMIAVDKPPGLPTLPGAGFLRQTLLARVRDRDPGATPAHRLGRWTSGIVLFARTPRARASLTLQWRDRTIVKRYRALAGGDPQSDAFLVEMPIGAVPHPLLGSVHAACASGKPASSHVLVLERRNPTVPRTGADREMPGAVLLDNAPDAPDATRGFYPIAERSAPRAATLPRAGAPGPVGGEPAHFLCDVRIDTGRPHQIRIHLAAAGFPLVGDPLYGVGGVPAPGSTALPGDPGYSLHAAELTFRHPVSGDIVVLASPPPPPLRRRPKELDT